MSTIMEFLSAASKVFYDKTYDYVTYYTSWSVGDNNGEGDNDEDSNEINDNNDSDNDSNDSNNSNDSINSNNSNNNNSINNNHIDNDEDYSKITSLSDSILDYKNRLNVNDYTDEMFNKRILPEISLLDQYRTLLDEPTLIIDNIYLGSAYNAASYNTLQKYNIKVIFNITTEISNYFPDEFTYKRYRLYDNNKESILEKAVEAYKKIRYHQKNTEGNILIHCYMGKSRSAAIVLYYIMKRVKHPNGKPFSFDDSLHYIRERRRIVNPTFRFTKDLIQSISPAITPSVIVSPEITVPVTPIITPIITPIVTISTEITPIPTIATTPSLPLIPNINQLI